MPKPGWRTISLRLERLDQLNQIYYDDRKRPANQEFGGWFDNLLLKYVEFNNDLKRYGPFLEFKDADRNMINLYDHQKNKPVTVFIDGAKKKLHCDIDKDNNCIHVGFCFAIPEVFKVLIDNGFKEPRR